MNLIPVTDKNDKAISMKQRNYYLTVHDQLLDELDRHELSPGSPFPSEASLMQRFAASRSTIRRALDRLEQQRRIVRRAGIGTFVSERNGRPLPDAVLNLGIEADIHSDPYYALALIDAVRNTCGTLNCDLVIKNVHELFSGQSGAAGVIFFQLETSEQSKVASLIDSGTEVVLINRLLQVPGALNLAVDYEQMVFRVTEQLLRNGARRIAFFGGSDDPMHYSPYHRKRGWRKAFANNGLPCPEELAPTNTSHSYQGLCDFFTRNRIEAAMLGYGGLCLPTFAALERTGLQLGRDLDLICFDDMSHSESLLPGPISYVKMPLKSIGRDAATFLAQKIRTGKSEISSRTYQPILVATECRYLF